jgi:hypothetical protein
MLHATARSNGGRHIENNKKKLRITINHDGSTCWIRDLPFLGRRIVSERWRINEGVEVGDTIDFVSAEEADAVDGAMRGCTEPLSHCLALAIERQPRFSLGPFLWRDLRLNVSSYILSLHLKTPSTSVATWVPAVA